MAKTSQPSGTELKEKKENRHQIDKKGEEMEPTKIKISKKIRVVLVVAFIAIYLLVTYISLRGQYLEYLELGEQYVEKFVTDIKYKYAIMGIVFVLLSIILYFTNRGIQKGLKPFF